MAFVADIHTLWFVGGLIAIIEWSEDTIGLTILVCHIEIYATHLISKAGSDTIGVFPVGILHR